MVTGIEITRARELVGENYSQFARRLGVDRTTITRWEKDGPPPRGTAQIALERVLSELEAEDL